MIKKFTNATSEAELRMMELSGKFHDIYFRSISNEFLEIISNTIGTFLKKEDGIKKIDEPLNTHCSLMSSFSLCLLDKTLGDLMFLQQANGSTKEQIYKLKLSLRDQIKGFAEFIVEDDFYSFEKNVATAEEFSKHAEKKEQHD